MAGIGDMPAFVAALPSPARRAIRKQCDGDWRRVTGDADGITVHNRPQRDLDPAIPAPATPADPPPTPQRAGVEVREDPPPPKTVRALRTSVPRLTENVDTTGFRRIDLYPVVPTKTIRKWAMENDQPVSQRGRIPESVVKAYHEANPLDGRKSGLSVPPLSIPKPGPLLFSSRECARPVKVRASAPLTCEQMLSKFTEMGCKYQPVPAKPYVQVFFHGHLLAVVRSEEFLDRFVVAMQYEAIRAELIARGNEVD